MKTELEQAKNWAKDRSYWEYLNLLRKYPQTNLANEEHIIYIWKKEHLVKTIEEGAKYQLSKEKTIIQLLKEMKPSDRVELISEYCNECGEETCYCKKY